MPECQVWRILLVDDDEDDYCLTRELLSSARGRKCHLEWMSSYEDGCRALKERHYEAVLVDYDLGLHRGLELIRDGVRGNYPAPFILLTGRGSYEVDLEAMQAGATLYLTKDEVNPLLLERSIRYAIERKQAEQALAEANALLLQQKLELEQKNQSLNDAMREVDHNRAQMEAIFAAQNDAVIIYDTAMNVQRVNPSFLGNYGFDPVGMNVREIIQRVNCRRLDGRPFLFEEQPTPRALRGEKITGEGFLVTRADGSEGAVATSSGPMHIGDQITGTVTVWHDITERARVERVLRENEAKLLANSEALRESERRFRVALAGMQMIVFSMDRDLRYTWIYHPQQALDINRFLGKRDDEIQPAGDVAGLVALKQTVIETGRPLQQEVKLLINGDAFDYIITLDPILDPSGQVIGLTGAALDVTQVRLLEAERSEHTTQVEVQRRLAEYREKERQEIARNLHDGPIQTLIGTIFNLQFVKEAFQDPALETELEKIGLSLKAAVSELREVVNELRPPSLIRFGIGKAIQMHAVDVQAKNAHIALHLDLPQNEGGLSEQLCLTVFRIYQEGINNIIRHAGASDVWICLTRDAHQVQLEIRDNGKGFTMPDDLADHTQHGHYGLAGMRERAEAIGGSLQITSTPGLGTTVHASVPVRP